MFQARQVNQPTNHMPKNEPKEQEWSYRPFRAILQKDGEFFALLSDEKGHDVGVIKASTLLRILNAHENLVAKFRELLNEDVLWLFSDKRPLEVSAKYETGGGMTHGPNNCHAFNEKLKAARAALSAATEGREG